MRLLQTQLRPWAGLQPPLPFTRTLPVAAAPAYPFFLCSPSISFSPPSSIFKLAVCDYFSAVIESIYMYAPDY